MTCAPNMTTKPTRSPSEIRLAIVSATLRDAPVMRIKLSANQSSILASSTAAKISGKTLVASQTP